MLGRRLSEDRMDRMLAAHEAVAPDEGFSAICTGRMTLTEILSQLLKEKEGTTV